MLPYFTTLMWHHSKLTGKCVLFWKPLTGNFAVSTLFKRQPFSLSLCLQYPVTVSLRTDSPSRARLVEHPRAREWTRISEEERTGRHHLHSSTTMPILGTPVLLFWLMWGHCCALSGKGRNMKKNHMGAKKAAFSRFAQVGKERAYRPSNNFVAI